MGFIRATTVHAARLFLLLVTAVPAVAHESGASRLQRLDHRIAEDPASVKALLDRAEVRRRRGEWDLALADCARASLLSPNDRRIWLVEGLVRADLGDADRAHALLTRYLDSDGPHPSAWVALAELDAAAGRTMEAAEDLRQALKRRTAPDLFLRRGKLLEKAGGIEEAIANYRLGLTTLGDAIVIREALVDVLLRTGRAQEALDVLSPVLQRVSRRAPWLLRRAAILDELGRHDDARRDREAALVESESWLRRRPTADAFVTRGRVLHAVGRRDDALNDIGQALRLAPGLRAARALRDEWSAQ